MELEREFMELWAEVQTLIGLARVRAPAFAEQFRFAALREDDNRPDPAKLREAKRAFLDLPREEQRRIMGDWRPVNDRPNSRRVAGDVMERSVMCRAMLIEPDRHNDFKPEVWHDYIFTDSTGPVTITIQEGTSADDVLNALETAKALLEKSYAELIDDQPAPLHYPDAAQVWRAADFQGFDTGYLVTELGNLDRPIAFIDSSGASELSGKEAREVAGRIAADPRTTPYQRCIDLRAYGYADSREPMPPFIYSLWCVPVESDRPGGRLQPSPYCRFRAMKLKEQEAAIGSETVNPIPRRAKKSGQSEGHSVLSRGSKANGKAGSPTAA